MAKAALGKGHGGEREQHRRLASQAGGAVRTADQVAAGHLDQCVLDSAAFSKLFAQAEMTGRDLVFLVGGADGLPPAQAKAAMLLSLSAMTFPHELARAMLAEQIYRAFAILRGSPYPR